MHIVWSTFFTQLIAFLILYYLLQRFAFKPLFGMMEKRRQHVLEQIQSAEASRKQSEQYLAEQKQVLQDAKKEAYNILEQSKQTSGHQADDIIAQAKAEANRQIEEALRDIESEKNNAIASLRSQVSAMSVMIASKIIEKQVDEQSQKDLVEHYLKEVGGNR